MESYPGYLAISALCTLVIALASSFASISRRCDRPQRQAGVFSTCASAPQTSTHDPQALDGPAGRPELCAPGCHRGGQRARFSFKAVPEVGNLRPDTQADGERIGGFGLQLIEALADHLDFTAPTRMAPPRAPRSACTTGTRRRREGQGHGRDAGPPHRRHQRSGSINGRRGLVTDRLIFTEQPSVLLVVETFAAVPYVHLHLESRRRFYPDVPIIVHDDGSDETARLQDIVCRLRRQLLLAPGEPRTGPARPLRPPAGRSVRAALGLDLAVQMSHDFVPSPTGCRSCSTWPRRRSTPPTAARGTRAACGASASPSTRRAGRSRDAEARMERAIESGLSGDRPVGDFLHDLALRGAGRGRLRRQRRLRAPVPARDD